MQFNQAIGDTLLALVFTSWRFFFRGSIKTLESVVRNSVMALVQFGTRTYGNNAVRGTPDGSARRVGSGLILASGKRRYSNVTELSQFKRKRLRALQIAIVLEAIMLENRKSAQNHNDGRVDDEFSTICENLVLLVAIL